MAKFQDPHRGLHLGGGVILRGFMTFDILLFFCCDVNQLPTIIIKLYNNDLSAMAWCIQNILPERFTAGGHDKNACQPWANTGLGVTVGCTHVSNVPPPDPPGGGTFDDVHELSCSTLTMTPNLSVLWNRLPVVCPCLQVGLPEPPAT